MNGEVDVRDPQTYAIIDPSRQADLGKARNLHNVYHLRNLRNLQIDW